ncbi:helix-turn-helix transcriptional regulator [Solihabitans fulvus]|uniref:Helix-turn-helix transcriptional regulator n=1 Tax=Solihabitans fulvus TaxID=1892852 RepID=A0A5B2XTF5_9PSEU|nr:helix-turn-helix domain-containing protein [Solihabitans fulvus]KAA2266139.1 helix-turn-helix transcriptional regulator [Solihabitans fulvus]
MPDPATPSQTVDLSTVKALAHPLRQRILRRLAVDGPATSTTLASELGVTSGGTSYNLRVLAEHGLIEEVPERGHGRERWWRHVRADLRMPLASQQDPAMRSALNELHSLWLAEDLESLGRFESTRHELGEWADALVYSRGGIHVTTDELRAFFEEYVALLMRYARPAEQAPTGARRVLTRLLAFPETSTTEPPEETTS